MKKIYLLAQQLNAGGVEKCICLLANAFIKQGYKVSIVSLLTSSKILELDTSVEVKFLTRFKSDRDRNNSLIYKLFRKLFTFSKLKKEIKKINNAIIISSRNEYTKILSKYGNSSQIKIGHLHSDHKFDESLLNDFKYNYANINYFVHLTQIVCDEITDVMKPYNKFTKNVYIPNFVSEYVCNDEISRKNFVISVGRFSKEKGFDRLLEIWSKVIEKEKGWKLLLIGDGSQKDNYMNVIKEKNMTDYIEMPGFLDNLEAMKLMNLSKIYALPSYEESFSLTCVEAMQNKLPIVSFDIRTGPKMLVKNEENGFLVENGNIDLFVEKLLYLMKNEDIRILYGKNGYIYSEQFVEKSVIDKWLLLFNREI
ncbi:MAG: glycosyltransferase [Spirochaetaceae bacterium]|nr:glycosyltransferase [Spirochaetaceae bacterium]